MATQTKQEKSEMYCFLATHRVSEETIQKLIENELDTIDHLHSMGTDDIDELCKEFGIKITQKIKLKTAITKLKQCSAPSVCATQEEETVSNPTNDVGDDEESETFDEKAQSVADEKNNGKPSAENITMETLDMSCLCNFKLGQRKLYFCNKCTSDAVYCEECGAFSHRIAAGTDHKWSVDIVEIPVINSQNYQNGEQQIIGLLGAERYKTIIAPKIRTLVTNAFTINNGAIIGYSAGRISASYNLGIASSNAVAAAKTAHKMATEVIKKSSQAMKAATLAKEAVMHLSEMKEIYTVGWSKNPFYWLYCLLYGDKAEEARVIYEQAVAARDLATQEVVRYAEEASKARQAVQSANQFSVLKAKQASNAAIAAEESMTLKLRSAACITAALTGVEMFIHGRNYGKGEISGYEFVRRSGKSLTRNIASAVGSSVGTQIGLFAASQLGMEFGNSICPGFGAMAACGAGLIGGMILSWKIGKTVENMFDQLFPCDEEKTRKELVHEALIYFRFTEEDIDNTEVFNMKRIKKEYKNAALIAHPDRNNGDHNKWNILSTYYGIVIGLLEQDCEEKQIVKKTVMQSLQ